MIKVVALSVSFLIVLFVAYGCVVTSPRVDAPAITAPVPPMEDEEPSVRSRSHAQLKQTPPPKDDTADSDSTTSVDRAISSTQRALDTLDKKDQQQVNMRK